MHTMQKVRKVKALPGYELEVEFDDGVHGRIQLKDRLYGPMFEPLKDPDYFRRVSVDEFGAICWPNQADLAPDALYRELTRANA